MTEINTHTEILTLTLPDGCEIRPRLIDGEPMCDGESCRAYFHTAQARFGYSPKGGCKHASFVHVFPSKIEYEMQSRRLSIEAHPCIPAIRFQRDKMIRDRDEARRELCELGASESGCDVCGCSWWSAIYPYEDGDNRRSCSTCYHVYEHNEDEETRNNAAERGWSYLYEKEQPK